MLGRWYLQQFLLGVVCLMSDKPQEALNDAMRTLHLIFRLLPLRRLESIVKLKQQLRRVLCLNPKGAKQRLPKKKKGAKQLDRSEKSRPIDQVPSLPPLGLALNIYRHRSLGHSFIVSMVLDFGHFPAVYIVFNSLLDLISCGSNELSILITLTNWKEKIESCKKHW